MMDPNSRGYKVLVRAYQGVYRRMCWLNELAARGIQPMAARGQRVVREVDRSFALLSRGAEIEPLEAKVMLSITPQVVSATQITFLGDGAADALYLRVNAGLLEYSQIGRASCRERV